MVTWRDTDRGGRAGRRHRDRVCAGAGRAGQPETELPPGPEQVMSDASPNRPTETLEEKIEEKLEQKVEAKVEHKVEEKVEREAGRGAAAGGPARAQSGGGDRAAGAAAGGQAGNAAAAGAARAGAVTSAPQVVPEETAAIPAAPPQGRSIPTIREALRNGRRRSWRCSSATSATRRRPRPAASRASPRSPSVSIGRVA